MVEVYESEQEQLDALKRWWNENGKAALAGVVLGVSGLSGWHFWEQHQNARIEKASVQYMQILQNVDDKAFDSIPAQVDLVLSEYGDTQYATLVQFLAAKAMVESSDLEGAKKRLAWVVAEGSTDDFKYIARLRLAAIHMAQDKFEEAGRVLEVSFPASYDARLNELKGDIAVASGDVTEARIRYDQALESKNPSSNRQLLQIKRDNLGATENVVGS